LVKSSQKNLDFINELEPNLLAAMFFSVTALGSILGMNLPHGLERFSAPWLFWGVLGFSFVLGFWLRQSLARAGSLAPKPPG
jgi:FtsH-binding integral membrane protein